MEGLESLFTKALELESPWEITIIEFNEGRADIKVFVDFPGKAFFRVLHAGKR